MIKSQLKGGAACFQSLMCLIEALDAAAELHICEEEDSTFGALMVLMQVTTLDFFLLLPCIHQSAEVDCNKSKLALTVVIAFSSIIPFSNCLSSERTLKARAPLLTNWSLLGIG